jgi:hypothetical protein
MCKELPNKLKEAIIEFAAQNINATTIPVQIIAKTYFPFILLPWRLVSATPEYS